MIRRRRRPNRDVAFGLDSFLDIIANVIGIIIRMILVVWVGARSYQALQLPPEPIPEAVPPLTKPVSHPLQQEIVEHRKNLQVAKDKLVRHMQNLESVRKQSTKEELEIASLRDKAKEIRMEIGSISSLTKQQVDRQQILGTKMSDIRQRSQTLLDDIRKLDKLPTAKGKIYYRTPLSRPVNSEELFFECQNGKVTFLDMDAFLDEILGRLKEHGNTLKTRWQVDARTGPIGAFRVHYVVARKKTLFDRAVGVGGPAQDGGFSYGLRKLEVEPILPNRGETVQQALHPQSEFRQIVDFVDPRQAVVTFWVYPDSFGLYRQLRDYMYQRGVEVAGRPLPRGVLIEASQSGTASLGQ